MRHSTRSRPPAETDVLIVGSGVAGLSAALELARHAPDLRVTLLTRGSLGGGGASPLAQGGIAAALALSDSPERHALDTLSAGDGLARPSLAEILTEEGVARVRELIEAGARFDRDEQGRLSLGLEGAHSRRRILHARGDRTGAEVTRALRDAVRASNRVLVTEGLEVLELLRIGRRVSGVLVGDLAGAHHIVRAHATVLATGGPGRVYLRTTAPPGQNGDGLALAARAGARLRDLEFVQFHPTALNVDADPLPLVTEALRGAGARLVDGDGRSVMASDADGELSSRDRVARTLWTCIREGRPVFLECRDRPGARIEEAFPGVFSLCLQHGINPLDAPIPVTPAAHYHMGGIAVDANGRTSLSGLWAVGEVAASGLHGANRLASNSLLEGLVFGPRAARSAIEELGAFPGVRRPIEPGAEWDRVLDRHAAGARSLPSDVDRRIRTLMWEAVGVVRDARGLRAALVELEQMEGRFAEAISEPARNALLVARLIAHAALVRRESIGSHFRSDHPKRSSSPPRHLTLSLSSGAGIQWEWEKRVTAVSSAAARKTASARDQRRPAPAGTGS